MNRSQSTQGASHRLIGTHTANPYPAPASSKRALRDTPDREPFQSTNVASYEPGSLSQALVDNPALAMVLADKPIVFHRVYHLLMQGCRESVRNAMVLAKLVELANTLSVDSGGWFAMSTEQWGELTDLSYTHHLAARKALMELGFLSECVPGFRQTKVYRVESEAIHAAILALAHTLAIERQAAEAAVLRH